MKILVADDAVIIRVPIVEALARLPAAVSIAEASDGVSAIDMFRRFGPQVVILDISMPNRNGIEVLEEIKRSAPHTIVIMFTDLDAPPYRSRCLAAGADYFLAKRTDFPRLLEIIRQLNLGSAPESDSTSSDD